MNVCEYDIIPKSKTRERSTYFRGKSLYSDNSFRNDRMCMTATPASLFISYSHRVLFLECNTISKDCTRIILPDLCRTFCLFFFETFTHMSSGRTLPKVMLPECSTFSSLFQRTAMDFRSIIQVGFVWKTRTQARKAS